MPLVPHCDELVLHSPGTCHYCDMYPEAQQRRIDGGVNFTGESDPAKKICPAEARRPFEVINKWYGNVASTGEALQESDGCPKCGDPGKWINLALVCSKHGEF